MKTVLIAVQSDEIAHALSEHLQRDFIVHSCSQADAAIGLLDRLHPDALILDLHLPHNGGFSVLREASYRPSAIIGLTRWQSAKILAEAEALSIHRMLMLTSPISVITDCLQKLYV